MPIGRYEGDREVLLPLFREADHSNQHIDAYLSHGEVFVAQEDSLVGHLQLIAHGETFELKNMAVVAKRRNEGIGSALVRAAIHYCQQRSGLRVVVSTAAPTPAICASISGKAFGCYASNVTPFVLRPGTHPLSWSMVFHSEIGSGWTKTCATDDLCAKS